MSKALELSKKYRTLLAKYEIDTKERKAMFFAQLDHESQLIPQEENLKYSKKRLLQIFSKYFNDATATAYAMKPEKIANRVYANRMNNGNEASGDGWRFRGRGFIQLTGRKNYTDLSKDTQIDYVNNPQLLLTEADAMISALWYWKKYKLNAYADKQDVRGATLVINGGTLGLDNRKNKFKSYLKEFSK